MMTEIYTKDGCQKVIIHSFIQRNFSVNKKDLQALTLVGLTRENPASDPLHVQHIDNQLYIIQLPLNNFIQCVELV